MTGVQTCALPILPVTVLSLGALDWSLFSGMEVAFFLGVWGWALTAATDLRLSSGLATPRAGWKLGLAGALLVATRPEAATSLAVLGLAGGWFAWRAHRRATIAVATVARAALPALAFLALQAVVNKWLTGESSAAGGIVKLALNNPFMTPGEKWDDYVFHLSYCVRRNLEHHFASVPYAGFIPVALALVLWQACVLPRLPRENDLCHFESVALYDSAGQPARRARKGSLPAFDKPRHRRFCGLNRRADGCDHALDR